jgi:oxygen-dependent protoporphyrinogen oxidase
LPEARVDVVVVGGGVAGLAVTRALAQKELSCALLESSPQWGGVVRTLRAGGFTLDAGPDSILAQKPEGIALCRELGLEAELVPTNPRQRAVYVLFGGRLHAMPEGMVLGVPTRPWSLMYSRLFTWPGKMRMALEPLMPGRRDGGDESIADFFRRRLGREALDRIGEPLLGGIHAGDPERLSILETFPRLREMEKTHGSLLRGMRAAAARAHGGAAGFLALKGGMSDLVTALVEQMPSMAALHTGAPVMRIVRDGQGFVVETPAALWRSRAVVVAAPAHRAAPLVAPLAADLGAALASIRFASTATVLLGFRREDVMHPLDGYGLVVPRRERLRTLACSFVSTKLSNRAPDGQVALRGFLGGMLDPQVVEQDDAALVQRVVDDMSGPLGIRGTPLLAEVSRYPFGTPQMEVGHSERMAAADRALADVPGLFLTGAGLRGTGLPDVIADATRIAGLATQYLS